MIEADVTDIVTSFSSFWGGLLRDTPRLAFNYTWPTIGTLQLLLSHLSGRETLDSGDRTLLVGASAYIGTFAHECWRTFGDEIDVTLSYERENDEIVLRAVGGRNLKKGESFSVKLTTSLAQVLRAPEDPFPFFADYRRPLMTHPPVVSLFALGVCTGLTPYGEGPWRSLRESEAKEHLVVPEMYLATTTAKHYEASFPSEPHGTDRELYASQLLLPPIGYRESLPGGRAAFGLARYVKAKGYTGEEMHTLGQNLAQLPEQQLSLVGFLLAAATAPANPSQRLRYMGEVMGSLAMFYKPALALLRAELGKPDPLKLVQEGKLDEAEAIFEIERALGLLPLVRDRLTELLPVDKLLARAYWCHAPQARQAIDDYAASQPLSAGLTLFGIYLDVMSGDFARAERELQDRDKNQVLTRLDSSLLRARQDEVIGYVAANMGNAGVAAPMFARAGDSSALSPTERSRFHTLHADVLMRAGRAEEALTFAAKALRLAPNLRAELFRFDLGFAPEDDRYIQELERLARSAPISSSLFQLLVRAKLRRATRDTE